MKKQPAKGWACRSTQKNEHFYNMNIKSIMVQKDNALGSVWLAVVF